MKSTFFALGALAAAVSAQDLSSLPQCGQTCAGNMLSAEKAKELNCPTNDLKCLCSNSNFVYGLRDCSKAICDADGASKVLQYAIAACKGAGVTIDPNGDGKGGNGGNNGGNGGETSGSGGNGGNGGQTSGGNGGNGGETSGSGGNNGGNGGQTGGNGGNGGAQVTTIFSTHTGEDGKVQTTAIATSTISGAGSDTTMATVTSGGDPSQTGGDGNNGGNNGGNGGETSGSGGEGGNGGQTTGGQGGNGGNNGGSGGTSTSSGFAAQMTAPAGVLAAAGIAALFL